jgi:sRNA-binding protein
MDQTRRSPGAAAGAKKTSSAVTEHGLPNQGSEKSPLPSRSPDETIALLAERWPLAFSIREQKRRPLKVGIYADIIAAIDGAATPADIAASLKQYVASTKYLERVRTGKPRAGLDGLPAGKVTAEEEQFAKIQISMRVDAEYRRRVNPSLRPKPIDPSDDPDGQWPSKSHPANADKPQLRLKMGRRS